ncbi:hypothetical protein MTR67_002147 [Solanum verrucosum]|uniref:Uncharacterized protein n=1 Tax=Solanum verrucosum TaxID=315347 RepID=A0AAF0PQF7_SOLVR|nr:hypothetical protein MTR67_002147 [Solanum verrucosum]
MLVVLMLLKSNMKLKTGTTLLHDHHQRPSFIRWTVLQIRGSNCNNAKRDPLTYLGDPRSIDGQASRELILHCGLSFIRDDVNLNALLRDPQVDLPFLGVDLVVDVEKIQRSIENSKARMEHMINKKIQTKLASLCADVDALLAPPEVVPKCEPEVETDEAVMTELFGDTMPPPDPSRVAWKCHNLIILLTLRSTTKSVLPIYEGTTDVVPSNDPTGSGKPDPPASGLDIGAYAP